MENPYRSCARTRVRSPPQAELTQRYALSDAIVGGLAEREAECGECAAARANLLPAQPVWIDLLPVSPRFHGAECVAAVCSLGRRFSRAVSLGPFFSGRPFADGAVATAAAREADLGSREAAVTAGEAAVGERLPRQSHPRNQRDGVQVDQARGWAISLVPPRGPPSGLTSSPCSTYRLPLQRNAPDRLGFWQRRHDGAVHAANIDCPPTAWPQSPRVLAATSRWSSACRKCRLPLQRNGPDRLGVCGAARQGDAPGGTGERRAAGSP